MRPCLLVISFFVYFKLFAQNKIIIRDVLVVRQHDTILAKHGKFTDTAFDGKFDFNPKIYFYNSNNSIGLMAKLSLGFLDTFSIANRKFRIRSSKKSCCIVETNIHGEWYKNFSFDLGQWEYDYSKDVNNDGFNDFLQDDKWTYAVFLFNPLTNKFTDTAAFDINNDWTILDSSEKIYCDFQPLNFSSNVYTSDLYGIKKLKKNIYYQLRFVQINEEGERKAELYKHELVNGFVKIKDIDFPKDFKAEDFDYKAFWKKRYKELLGY